MRLGPIELILQTAGGLSAFIVLGILLYGILSRVRRAAGRTTGRTAGWQHSSPFYLFTTAFFLALSVAFWKTLPLSPTPSTRSLALVVGVLFYFPGLAFLLWGRLTLGNMYFVSTTFYAQLFAKHQFVRHGPYAIVRHPMYLGLITAAVGSLLLYHTWTTVLFAFLAPFTLLRARREEQVLSVEFGEEWRAYSRRVPPFFPRLIRRE